MPCINETCKGCELKNCGIKDPTNYYGEPVFNFQECIHYTCRYGMEAAARALSVGKNRTEKYKTEDGIKEAVTFGTPHKPTQRNGKYVRIATIDRTIYSLYNGIFIKTGQEA